MNNPSKQWLGGAAMIISDYTCGLRLLGNFTGRL
ncbi:hypothetical protein ABH892_000373 [Paenibacillus sp. RC254]